MSGDHYKKMLADIKEEGPYSFKDLSLLIGISYATLKRVLDDDSAIAAKTQRKIKEFVEKYTREKHAIHH